MFLRYHKQMARQEKKVPKKRGRPATGVGEQIQVRIQPDLLSPLDAWIADRASPPPTRAEAIRLALREWLVAQGRLKPPALDPEAITEKIAELDAKAAALKHDGTPAPANALKTMKRAVVKNEATKLRNKLAKAKKA